MPTLLHSSLLLSLTLLTTLTTATSTPQSHCPGPILPNNICCANGYEIDSTTNTARCNVYGTTTFRAVLANPTSSLTSSIPSVSATADTNEAAKNQDARALAMPSNNDAGGIIIGMAKPTPTPIILITQESTAIDFPQPPSPTPTSLSPRQYGTVTYPDGGGNYGTVAYPDGGGIYSDPYYGGGYEGGNGYGGYGNGGGYPIGYSGRATYVTEGPGGPVTITKSYHGEAAGRVGVGAGVGVGVGLVGLMGLAMV